MGNSREVNMLAREVVDALKCAGFTVHRYNSYSTNSIFLKVDYGVCKSIRISDHGGKQYLKYRYNIGTNYDEIKSELVMFNGYSFERFYYPACCVGDMLFHIRAYRDELIAKYGKTAYMKIELKEYEEHIKDKGFWQQARLVNKGEYFLEGTEDKWKM